jgi:predicted secreted hydrolase
MVWSAIGLLMLPLLVPVAANAMWKTAQPDYHWSFPEDHWARQGYQTEWWYLTGHVEAEAGRRFGYQFTFFRIGVLAAKPDLDSSWAVRDLIMGHAAISDLDQNTHYFSEILYRATPLLGGFGTYPDPRIAWSRGPAGTDGNWQLRWNGDAFDVDMRDDAQHLAFSLSTHPVKPLVLQGPNGYSRKDREAAAASQYYSFTRLQTTGRIRIDGKTWAVSGESWMDKEFSSNQLAPHQVGWDWFSLQLDDQREIMLYLLRHQNGTLDFARGTVVKPDGQTTYLSHEAFRVTAEARWKSPHTSGAYPSQWRLVIPQEGLNLRIVAEMADQENRSRITSTMHYWEGAVRVQQDGKPAGKGYVELTGYGTSSRPAL